MSANHLKAYFNFSKKERIGIIALIAMVVLLWFAPELFNREFVFDENGYAAFRNDIEQLRQQPALHRQKRDSAGTSYSSLAAASFDTPSHSRLFYFDPNTLSPEGWKQLGVPDKTIKTIQNFITRGGRFYKAEDIGKVYGLRKRDYERLLPYVRITGKKHEQPVKDCTVVRMNSSANVYADLPAVEINTADTIVFKRLPGISGTLAKRMVSFRDKLGGFYSVDQVAEVYGLSEPAFQLIKPYLRCDAEVIRKINVNAAGLDELKAHPYIKYQVGNAVIQYRQQHGPFQNRDDLSRLHVLSDDLLQKLGPYLSY